MALSLLGSANLIRPGLRPNGSSHTASRHRHLGKGRVPGKRFAKQSVGRWVKRAAQGWVGENGDRSERALHPLQGAGSYPTHPYGKGNNRARKEHL
jgi:hypothetical protein